MISYTLKTLIKEYNKLQNIMLNFTYAINSLTRDIYHLEILIESRLWLAQLKAMVAHLTPLLAQKAYKTMFGRYLPKDL